MADITQVTDETRNSVSWPKNTETFRPLPGSAYPPGTVCQLVALDAQVFPDGRTVQPIPAAANGLLAMGVVGEDTAGTNLLGFTGGGGTSASGTVATQSLMRFNQTIKLVNYGFHPGLLVDQQGAGAVTITNGVLLQSSARTAGRVQGITSGVAGAIIGNALLPASGVGSSLTAGALTAGTSTSTVGGAPATGDTLSVTFQIPYSQTVPGTAQTRTVTATLTSAQAVSTTTAATALAAALNADAVYAKYYTATSAAAVVTSTPNATALFALYFTNTLYAGLPTTVTPNVIALAGSAANGLTFTAAATGGSTLAQSGNIAGGVGYFGPIPAWVSIY